MRRLDTIHELQVFMDHFHLPDQRTINNHQEIGVLIHY